MMLQIIDLCPLFDFSDLEHTNKDRIPVVSMTRDLKNDPTPGAKA
jgi:hypothetical protein